MPAGEIALMSVSSKSTANVIAREPVSCMSLSKADFHLLLSSIEEEMMLQNMAKGINEGVSLMQLSALKQLTSRRRISGLDVHNVRSEARIDSILMRMGKFMTESRWNSMYSRYYRSVCVRPDCALCW